MPTDKGENKMLTEKEINNYCDYLRTEYEDIKPESRHFNRNDYDEYMEGSLNIFAVKIYFEPVICRSTHKLIKGHTIFTYCKTNEIQKAIDRATYVYGDINTEDRYILEVYNLEPNLDDESLTLQEMNFEKVKDLNILLERKI